MIFSCLGLTLVFLALPIVSCTTRQPFGVLLCQDMCESRGGCRNCSFKVSNMVCLLSEERTRSPRKTSGEGVERRCKVITPTMEKYLDKLGKSRAIENDVEKTNKLKLASMPQKHINNSSMEKVNASIIAATQCGEPEKKANTEVSYTSVDVCSIATYTCVKGCRSCDQSQDVSVCHSTGEWGNTSIQCHRYRWPRRHMPKKEQNTLLHLCPTDDRFKLKFVATPTSTFPKQMDIQLAEDENAVLAISIRFMSGLDFKKTVVNNLFMGNFGKELRFKKFPFKKNKRFIMIITYQNRIYQITVNGQPLLTFHERPPNRKPTAFGYSRDMKVHLVEILKWNDE